MKHTSIYLAGKMSGLTYFQMSSWRTCCEIGLGLSGEVTGCDVTVYNPINYYNFENPIHQSEKEVMDFDLALVAKSDVVLVNLDGLGTSDGTKIELFLAHKLSIPVIAFGAYELYDNLHPWIKECITRRENTNSSAIAYIKNFYMI